MSLSMSPRRNILFLIPFTPAATFSELLHLVSPIIIDVKIQQSISQYEINNQLFEYII